MSRLCAIPIFLLGILLYWFTNALFSPLWGQSACDQFPSMLCYRSDYVLMLFNFMVAMIGLAGICVALWGPRHVWHWLKARLEEERKT